MQSLRSLTDSECLVLVEYLPRNIYYLFTHSPGDFSQEFPARKEEPYEANLGKFVERIASVILWEMHGRRNIFKQPPFRRGTHADLVAISRFGACLYDFTTSPTNVLGKIEMYGKKYPVVLIIAGKDAYGGPQRYEGSYGFIWGMRNYAAIWDETKGKQKPWTDDLRYLDAIVEDAKSEVAAFQ